jgi:hypothetical protein
MLVLEMQHVLAISKKYKRLESENAKFFMKEKNFNIKKQIHLNSKQSI